MADMGILCSCGNPIAQERIDELISPTAHLVRLLNQSDWMSALLVDTPPASGIPESRVLLDLLEGAEEVDAFVNLEGTLIMFELKDSQFRWAMPTLLEAASVHTSLTLPS